MNPKNEGKYSVPLLLDKQTYKRIQELMPMGMAISEQISILLTERLEQLEKCGGLQ
jgi:hypothetical protein